MTAEPKAMTVAAKPNGHDKPKCGATTRAGAQCQRPAGWGTDHVGGGNCKLHLGCTASGRKHGAREVALGQAGELLAQARVLVEGRTLAEAMDQALIEAGSMTLILRWMIDELEERSEQTVELVEGPRGGEQRVVHTAALGLYGADHLGDLAHHPLMADYRAWVELYARLVKTAHDIGIDERRQALNEDVVERLFTAVRGIVTDLGKLYGFSPTDPKVVVPLIRKHLELVRGA